MAIISQLYGNIDFRNALVQEIVSNPSDVSTQLGYLASLGGIEPAAFFLGQDHNIARSLLMNSTSWVTYMGDYYSGLAFEALWQCDPEFLLSRMLLSSNAKEKIALFLCDNYPGMVPAIFEYMRVSEENGCYDDIIQMLKGIIEDNDLPGLTEFLLGLQAEYGEFVYNMLYDAFNGSVYDDIFTSSTFHSVLQQALFHCASRVDLQNFFLAWSPSNISTLRSVIGDAYLMYLYFNAYPALFTSHIMDYIGAEEFYRAFERMPNFDISNIMALLQNSMDPGHYEEFAEAATAYLNYEEKFSLSEQYIYGSKRLGIKRGVKQIQSHTLYYESGNWYPGEVNFMADPVPAYVAQAGGLVDVGYANGNNWISDGKLKYPAEAVYSRKLGLKEYELTNHLGNVQATILDRRLGVKNNVADTIFSYIEADVKTAQDYYPFGMLMPGRHYTTGTAALEYRYGFNGKEKDNEVYGTGNSYDFGARILDPRIGRWLSVDPFASKYPDLTPYNFVANMPIKAIDPDGKQIVIVGSAGDRIKIGLTVLRLMSTKEGRRIVGELAASSHNVVLFNDPGITSNKYLGSYQLNGNTYHEINFNPSDTKPHPSGMAKENGQLDRNPVTSLYHELRHAEQEILGLQLSVQGVNNQTDRPIPMNEVDATYGENLVRQELGHELRESYDGTNVSEVSGVRGLPVTDYDSESGWPYQFKQGDYGPNFKTMKGNPSSKVKIEVKGGSFAPKHATKQLKTDGKATVIK